MDSGAKIKYGNATHGKIPVNAQKTDKVSRFLWPIALRLQLMYKTDEKCGLLLKWLERFLMEIFFGYAMNQTIALRWTDSHSIQQINIETITVASDKYLCETLPFIFSSRLCLFCALSHEIPLKYIVATNTLAASLHKPRKLSNEREKCVRANYIENIFYGQVNVIQLVDSSLGICIDIWCSKRHSRRDCNRLVARHKESNSDSKS